ncbi:MAG: universal stress protein [Fidelibacterota bacterium]
MKFLLAVGSKEYSEPTLDIGSRIARTFAADLSVVYVGTKPKEMFAGRVNLVFDSMAKWKIYHPGIDILHWAFDYLNSSGYLESKQTNGFNLENVVPENDYIRIILKGSYGRNVDLILREGEIIDELRREALREDYTLTIIGGSQKRSMAHDLLQYIPTSIFVVKNFDTECDYRLLLLVDDSKATRRAVRFGATIAANQGMTVDTLTVSKTKRFGSGYSRAAKAAGRFLKSKGIPHEQHFLTGDPVSTFVEFAGENHLMVMGASSQSPLKKFFLSSKPMLTLEKATAPILIVK